MKNKLWIILKAFLISCSVTVSMQAVGMEAVSDKTVLLKNLYFAQQCFYGRQEVFTVLMAALLFLFWKWSPRKLAGRYQNCLAIGCALFAVLVTTSASFELGGGLYLIFGSGRYVVRALIKSLGYFLLLYESSRFLITSGLVGWMKRKSGKVGIWLFASRYCKWKIWGILFICWFPYFIICYPGNMTLDAKDEIAQAFQRKEDSWSYHTVVHENENDNAIMTHHPVLYTCFIGGGAILGEAMGDINLGIALCSLVQLLAAISAITYLLCIMVRRKIPILFLDISLLFFALFPIFPMYAVTLTKDMAFATVMLWMLLEFVQFRYALKEEGERCVYRVRLHGILYAVAAVLFCLLRNNGVYILILVLPFLFFCLKRKSFRIRSVLLTCVPIFIYFVIFSKILLPLCEIEKGSVREMLCVPFQQTARYISEWGTDGLNKEDIQAIGSVMNIGGDIAVLKERYNPTYADPVKVYYNKWATNQDLLSYIRVWARMVLRHPGTAIAATMHGNYVLTSSGPCGKLVYVNQVEANSDQPNWYGIKENKYAQKLRGNIERALEKIATLPLIGLLFSLGFYDWLLVFAIMVMIARRQYEKLMVPIFFVMCIATCILGPIIYMRYALPWIMGIPFVGMLLISDGKKEKTN